MNIFLKLSYYCCSSGAATTHNLEFSLLQSVQAVINTALSCAFTLWGTLVFSSSVELVKYSVISDKGQHTVHPWGNLPAVAPLGCYSEPIPHKGRNIQCPLELHLLLNPVLPKTGGSESDKDPFVILSFQVSQVLPFPTSLLRMIPQKCSPCANF